MARHAIIMGVSGCGKSSVGESLAHLTGLRFLDGDQLHPRENVRKMSDGIALTDADRWPWLEAIGHEFARSPEPMIIGCSALKRSYRDRIRLHAAGPVCFIHLAGSREVISRRMQERRNHFMPLTLLDSQFAALEPPGADEEAIAIDIDQPLDEIVARARHYLEGQDHD